jgi:hypothetical protein
MRFLSNNIMAADKVLYQGHAVAAVAESHPGGPVGAGGNEWYPWAVSRGGACERHGRVAQQVRYFLGGYSEAIYDIP